MVVYCFYYYYYYYLLLFCPLLVQSRTVSEYAEKVFFERRLALCCKCCPDPRSSTPVRHFLSVLVLLTLFQSLNWFL